MSGGSKTAEFYGVCGWNVLQATYSCIQHFLLHKPGLRGIERCFNTKKSCKGHFSLPLNVNSDPLNFQNSLLASYAPGVERPWWPYEHRRRSTWCGHWVCIIRSLGDDHNRWKQASLKTALTGGRASLNTCSTCCVAMIFRASMWMRYTIIWAQYAETALHANNKRLAEHEPKSHPRLGECSKQLSLEFLSLCAAPGATTHSFQNRREVSYY